MAGPHTFSGGAAGAWRITRITAVKGDPLPSAERLAIMATGSSEPGARWSLRGAASYERYVTRPEHQELAQKSPPLGRPEARCAALIPIRKSDAWWALSQDERRAIFEEQTHHIHTGITYLPAIARQLYHSRDLGEPFDFLTWFEFSPQDAPRFEELLQTLRGSAEWTYVIREVDIRVERD